MPKLFENEIVNTEEELSETKTPKHSEEGSHPSEEGSGTGTGTGSEGSGEEEGTGDEGTGDEGTGDDEGTGTGSDSEDSKDEKDGSGSAESGSKESSDKDPKAAKKDNEKVKAEPKKDEPKTKAAPEPKADKTKAKDEKTGGATVGATLPQSTGTPAGTAGPYKGKLFKKGASGMHKVEERSVVLEGTTLSYFKTETDMNANKKGKTIDVNKATVAKGKDDKGKFYINITTSSKKKREIAAKSKDEQETWLARLTQAAAGAAAASPSVKDKTDDKPAKTDKAGKEDKDKKDKGDKEDKVDAKAGKEDKDKKKIRGTRKKKIKKPMSLSRRMGRKLIRRMRRPRKKRQAPSPRKVVPEPKLVISKRAERDLARRKMMGREVPRKRANPALRRPELGMNRERALERKELELVPKVPSPSQRRRKSNFSVDRLQSFLYISYLFPSIYWC